MKAQHVSRKLVRVLQNSHETLNLSNALLEIWQNQGGLTEFQARVRSMLNLPESSNNG